MRRRNRLTTPHRPNESDQTASYDATPGSFFDAQINVVELIRALSQPDAKCRPCLWTNKTHWTTEYQCSRVYSCTKCIRLVANARAYMLEVQSGISRALRLQRRRPEPNRYVWSRTRPE